MQCRARHPGAPLGYKRISILQHLPFLYFRIHYYHLDEQKNMKYRDKYENEVGFAVLAGGFSDNGKNICAITGQIKLRK